MTAGDDTRIPLSASRLSNRRICPRMDWFRYECGIIPERTAPALRIGSAFHYGQELRVQGDDIAIAAVAEAYDTDRPIWAEPYEWAIERETVRMLLAGHFWRYGRDDLETVATELRFDIPLLNPATGRESRTFRLVGVIDRIVKHPDGRLAVMEFKTAGRDIGDGSDYWTRLRYDGQISLYVLAARRMGYAIDHVLYDVTRKPSIGPIQIAKRDADGFKIVLDAAGNRVFTKTGKPRETGSTADGYELQSEPETPAAFAERLLNDIGERPDYYFARRELPRLDADLTEYEAELWQQAHALRECQKCGLWFRNVSAATCDRCDYAGPCLSGITIDPEHPPVGFTKRGDDSANGSRRSIA